MENFKDYIIGGLFRLNSLLILGYIFGFGIFVSFNICMNLDKVVLDDGFRSYFSGYFSLVLVGM